MNRKYHPISAVILAHQYSELFEKVIQSVTWCDEIVVVTSERIKQIEDLCQRVSAKCHYREFDGYGTQKQFAISLASHDWILNIDSDEWVSPECQKQIQDLLFYHLKPSFSALKIRQKFVFLNSPLNFSGTRSSPIRLFHKKQAQMNASSVHEDVFTSEQIGFVTGPIYHYSYLSLEDYFNKFNKYTSLAAQELFKKGKRTNFLFIWGRFPLLFLRRYILQLGILDGCNGFLWCWLSAFYSVVKYLKLQELNRNKKR